MSQTIPMGIFLSILINAIWGFGFVTTRWTFPTFTPMWSNTLRFCIAALGAILFFILRRKKITSFKAPFYCAIFLWAGMWLQTVGIKYTTLAKSGFLTALYAIITPIAYKIITKRKYSVGFWILLINAFIGIALLCELELGKFNYGDLLTVFSAIFFSANILAIDYFAKDAKPIEFNFLQCIYIGIISLFIALIFEGAPDLSPLWNEPLTIPSPLVGLLFLGIASSLGAFSLQVYIQKKIAAHIVSLVFLLESVFATLFGALFLGEMISSIAIFGGLLILGSIALVPKFTNYEKKKKKRN